MVGYLRVSTADQAESGAGLSAQREAIEVDCQRRGWQLVTIYEDTASGKSLNGRPQLKAALAELAAGNAEVLMSSKLDRLSRSAVDFGQLLETARKQGWKVVVLDLGVDTSTPAGELVAGVMVQVAQFERRRIGERTKDALEQKAKSGVRLGRPRSVRPDDEAFVVGRRAQGASMREIADELTERGAAPGCGPWRVSVIQRILARNPLPSRHAG